MRGRALLIYRLVASSLRGRPVEVVVTVVAIAAATTTLMVGLALRDVSAHPYQTTRALTAGPDIAAMPSNPSPASLAHLEALQHAPGVVSSVGPFPVSFPIMTTKGSRVLAIVEGRSQSRSAIDQPYVTQGSWVRPGGVVIERAFADELSLAVSPSAASAETGRSPMSSTTVSDTDERAAKALETESSTRWRRTRAPRSSTENQATLKPSSTAFCPSASSQWLLPVPLGPAMARFSCSRHPLEGGQALLGGHRYRRARGHPALEGLAGREVSPAPLDLGGGAIASLGLMGEQHPEYLCGVPALRLGGAHDIFELLAHVLEAKPATQGGHLVEGHLRGRYSFAHDVATTMASRRRRQSCTISSAS